MTRVYQLDPLRDPRWEPFVQTHAQSSVFHSTAWLQALCRTYGYQPLAITHAAPDGALADAVLLCRVKSWLTGSRLVSLPFSDHCQPLVPDVESLHSLVAFLPSCGVSHVEIRALRWPAAAVEQFSSAPGGERYHFHILNLRPGPEALFRGFHKDCVQRKIHRAEREALSYEEGRCAALLAKFYTLHVATRRRQGAPVQPAAWFQNLADCMACNLKVRVASKDGRPVASIITLQHGRSMTYKYGASDKAASALGGTPFLLWKAIQDAKDQGLLDFDLGRTDWDNESLARFKDRLGAQRSTLTYWRSPPSSVRSGSRWTAVAARHICTRMPESCVVAAGKLLYRHLG